MWFKGLKHKSFFLFSQKSTSKMEATRLPYCSSNDSLYLNHHPFCRAVVTGKDRRILYNSVRRESWQIRQTLYIRWSEKTSLLILDQLHWFDSNIMRLLFIILRFIMLFESQFLFVLSVYIKILSVSKRLYVKDCFCCLSLPAVTKQNVHIDQYVQLQNR